VKTNINSKLFLQTLITVFIIMIFGGVFYIKSINTVFSQNVDKDVLHDTVIIDNYIQNIEKTVTTYAKTVASSDEIIASLNLISKYEDRNDYKNIVFDTEKRKLLDKTGIRIGSDVQNLEATFYNHDREFIAKFASNSSYLSWENGQSVIVSNDGKQEVQNIELLKEKCINTLSNKANQDTYGFCYTQEIFRSNTLIGYVRIAYTLDKNDLFALKKNLSNNLYLSSEAGVIVDFDLNAIDMNDYERRDVVIYKKEPKITAHFLIDTTFLEQEKKSTINTLLLLALFLVGLSFFVSWYISKHLIIDRLAAIKDAMESIKTNGYKKIINKTDDELGKIIEDFNEISEKLADNFAFLESYRKSVDVANIVSTTDVNGIITYVNEEFEKTSGYTKDELVGKSHRIVRHPDMKKETFKKLWDTIQSGQSWHGIIKNRKKDGGYYWADSVVSPVFDKNGGIKEYISIRRDITELVEQKDELHRLANYDAVTGLGSRNKLQADIDADKNPTVALVNINRFSQINDFYGHRFGDLVLKKFAKNLQKISAKYFENEFTLYRPNSDEFILLVDSNEPNIVENIEKVLNDVEATAIKIGNEEVDINVSCGVSFEPKQSLLLTADMALKVAKKENKTYVVYSSEKSLNTVYENNIKWTSKLKDAISNDRIVPYFQPIVSNESLAYEKYESLVRMIDDEGNVISPFFFLDIAKQTKQYSTLTKIMIEKSFAAFADRSESFSINLTAEDIQDVSVAEFIAQKLREYPTIGNRVIFEIVESESIESYDEVIAFIDKAKHMGCRIAIDDFGTGYSNFEYLVKLKADFIKIDGSLIKNIVTSKEAQVVVSIIVKFAHEMGMKTVAEFVEDEDILNRLQKIGVDYSQGYHFSPPVATI
jgi:PAS domain S-box-containing protein/diguanylate cyclase (GGDEF)-like protein